MPLSDAEIDTAFASFAEGQNAEWLKGLLKESCAGSLNPGGCFNSLAESSALTGPLFVPGPIVTTTGTYTKADGTTGSTQVVSTTNYNVKYGPSYYDYSEHKTNTEYKDGQIVGTETSTDGEEVVGEEPAEEEKEEEKPMPCTSNCDGTEYVDQYEPTDKTKEDELDSYSSKLQNIPIFAAVSGFFDVSLSEQACPSWTYQGELSLPGSEQAMSIDLTFDYHCLPWFVETKPWVQAVMALACTIIAIRIGLL
ncbi:hypothetical protein [Pseudomonas anguilliseptica]|uniref:hypothetical protein n=1 Tax=Pseudomonas anguilliseptica TaxID=53406 RepID=UPI00325A805B